MRARSASACRTPSSATAMRSSRTRRDARGPAPASDGWPLADRKWPPRYAARRIAWHALDHAWEMEDRTDRPEPGQVGPRRTQPVADHAAIAMTDSAERPAARSSRTPVSPADFESFRPSGRRTSGWWSERRRRLASEQPAEPDLGGRRLEQVSTADTRSTPWRRSSTTTQNPYVQLPCRSRIGRSPRRRDVARARSDERVRPGLVPPPSAARSTGPSSAASRQPPGQPGPDQGRPCPQPTRVNVAREQSQP